MRILDVYCNNTNDFFDFLPIYLSFDPNGIGVSDA